MSLIKINKSVINRIKLLKRHATTSAAVPATDIESEYTAIPKYPPILDLSYEKVVERRKSAEHEEIKAVKTVEEKQIKLNMPKYYGFKCYMFKENYVPYNDLNLVQHVTRTHLIVNENLPDYFNQIDSDKLYEKIKSAVEEVLILEYAGIKRKHKIFNEDLTKEKIESISTSSVTRQINRIIINSLSKEYLHLINSQIDLEPRIESFWFCGGMNPPEAIKRYRRGRELTKPRENEPVDRAIQYIGSPTVTLRSNLPLPPILSLKDAENTNLEVPYFQYDPRVAGTEIEYRHAANIPGFWPGDSYKFGLLSYNNRSFMLTRNYDDPEENKDALCRQGILLSYAWLNAQANFLGFTTFNDITYPLVTQTVITNGQLWSFYAYQLNTLLVHSKNTSENPKRNICWATPEMKLFEEIKDEKLIGFNDDLLKMLIKFYGNVPKERLGINLMPYLSTNEKIAADYEDDDKRKWLEREYKFLVANRPRHKLMDEIYAWEKIYKIDHKTRPQEKRSRFFELFKKPSDRRLDDRKPEYIPRAKRPDLPRSKGRDAKEYFP